MARNRRNVNNTNTPQKHKNTSTSTNKHKNSSNMIHITELREIVATASTAESSKTAELRSFNLSKEVSAVPEITVTPEMEWETVGAKTGAPLEQPRVKIETWDVQGELEFWSSSVFCFVLGANPPNHVMDGYVRRVWKDLSIDKVAFQYNGVCIVRFSKQEDKDTVLQSEQLFFDNKPFIIRDWQPDVKCVKDKPDLVRIWVRLYNLDLKFWGKALPKIVSMIGTPINPYRATEKKEYLEYARFMVEVKMGHNLPDMIEFIDDKDVIQKQAVSYEWKPLVCSQCTGIGHDAAMCRKHADEVRKKPAQKVWRPKVQVLVKPAVKPVVQPVVVPVQVVESMQETVVMPQVTPHEMITPIPFKSKEMASPASLVHRLSRFGRGNSQGGPTVLEVVQQSLRVKIKNKARIQDGFGRPWQIIDNSEIKDSGRIWLLWDSSQILVQCIKKELQVIHARVTNLVTGNTIGPWLVMGDFNNVLFMDERIGSQVTDAEGLDGIDRVLANDEWILTGPTGSVTFLPEGLYDHSPCLIELGADIERRKGNFKYFNMWGKHAEFKSVVNDVWRQTISGCCMFQVVKKLKYLKHPLKKLNNGRYGDIENSALVAKMLLESIQKQLHTDPRNVQLQNEERIAADSYKELDDARLLFLAQKAKTQWVNYADDNTRYFHSTIKARRAQNKVLRINDMNGVNCTEVNAIEHAFVEYYQALLGSSTKVTPVCRAVVKNGKVVSSEHARGMVKQVTADEIREALFSIPVEKAPGPDGYSAGFFRDAYDIIGGDVINAAKEFFTTGKLLQQVNATVLTLIPKMDCPSSVNDFRPIACCNVMYKCISKIICSRLSGVLMDIVSMNQSAFIKDREIVDNILICQDLVRLYGRKTCTPRAMLKIDLKKA
ncbi:uncharacterized protein LOC141601396 [Silene latifolia]|uniref:uncharacterized protein LOC141601396 n=1 Tax=Silene latifolia TaxID=37657 RepID=UPI003D78277A